MIKDPTMMRTDDVNIVQANNSDNTTIFTTYFSMEAENQATAILGIGRTIFVCVVLSIASIYFSNDATVLVLNPIERMLEKVKMIAKNPLAAASDEIE